MPEVIVRARPKPPCPCGCGTPHGFCAAHKQRLGLIASEFQAGRTAKSQKGAAERSPGRSTCCFPGCWESRSPTAAYCWEHADTETPE